jgi:hypothetical protein
MTFLITGSLYSAEWQLLNYELERMGKEVEVAKFEALS